MSDLLMIVITVAALVLCQIYVKWCDRIATADLDEELDATVVASVDEQVSA